ncbi:MAG: hypothetical protein HFE84_09765 [Lachnospiraceae bacterium]|nr:hypothetical protein [Lachnospiraceae bacterium]
MEKISINHLKTRYEIVSIRSITNHILQIVFKKNKPTIWGDIHLYTRDGREAAVLIGYKTLYRDEGQTVYLSKDESVSSEIR